MSFVRTLETDQRENAITVQARQLLADHREADALRLYQEHFKGTPATVADSYVFIGKLELFMGNTEDGLRNLHHALQLDPTVRGAHTYVGILALKNADLASAEREFTAELANDPNYQMAIAEMGEVYYRQQKWAEAAQLLAKSRTMTPELLYMLSDSYFHTGDITDANLTAETAVAYGRKNTELVQGILDLLNRNGQSALAQRLAADLNP
jgi:tetratricopeptide (TPR) repeat protein